MNLLHLAQGAALAAGRLQRESFEKEVEIRHKGEIDLVTEIDLASERLIADILSSSGLPILGEEEAKTEATGTYWLVDPLDGTTNYAHGFPWFAPSIALMQDKEPVLGVVYHVMTDELFWAQKGNGAFLNGRQLRVSQTRALGEALLATGFPYNVHQKPTQVLGAFGEFLTRAQGIRRAGAAALDLAYVACGRFDGFWEMLLKPWDTAAGVLLVREAGGQVTDFLGQDFDPFVPHVVASNGRLHKELVEITARYLPEA